VFSSSSLIKQQLSDNEIHLWTINPHKVTGQDKLNSLKALLSHSELEKVQRYRLPEARHNALITRAFVRSVLASYTGMKAQDVKFKITRHGKPELGNSSLPIRFNLSHNKELIICAVCLKHDIGCDVESLYRKININNIAQRYFAVDEYHALQTVPSARQKTRFFEYWTLKEAFVKATGLGISQGLNTFSFQIGKAAESAFNDNIALHHSENITSDSKSHNSYCCLSYPDKTHCIAICMNNVKRPERCRVKYFIGNDYL
jgi:4'-phosphopantetheinyl transferase